MKKRCRRCGELKDADEDYYVRKREKLKSGGVNLRRDNICKRCYRREAQLQKRKQRVQGVYRPVRELVDAKLFLEWLDQHPDATLTQSEQRRLRDARAGRSNRIDISMVDSIMTREGYHDQVAVWFPLEEDSPG